MSERFAPVPTKKLSSGLEMPVYGLGTWGMGGTFEKDTAHDEQDKNSIRTALEHGIFHIDTAEMYGAGHAEKLIGEVIQEFPRDQLFLASKAFGHRLGRHELVQAAKESLQRLNTEYLDLYMIHHPNDAIPIQETMEAMDELLSEGLIRFIGVSNFTQERLQRAQDASRNQIVVNQVHYSLAVREPESELLPYCQANDVMLVAWKPLENVINNDSKQLLTEIAEKYGRTETQIALNWLISQDNVVVISKTGNPEHLEDNLGALGWNLSPNDIEQLRKEFPGQKKVSDVYSLK